MTHINYSNPHGKCAHCGKPEQWGFERYDGLEICRQCADEHYTYSEETKLYELNEGA